MVTEKPKETQETQGKSLPLMEEFYTIQGEGFHTGKSAYFIRLGGCDVGCHWCDVKESWDSTIHPLTKVEDIVSKAKNFAAKSVVITGGEPLMYDLCLLTEMLKDNGITIFLETSGSWPISGSFDWICLSPKKFKKPLPGILQIANELKVIIQNKHDFIWAEEHASQMKENCFLYLQPEWSRAEKMLPEIIEYVKNHPKWMISLQTHKYMGIP